MTKKSQKLVLNKEVVKFLRAKGGKKVRAVMKVVTKNQRLQVRVNFTDPNLGVKKGGRVFKWRDTFEEANLFLMSWENDQLVEDHKLHSVTTRLYSIELEEAERAYAILKSNHFHSPSVLSNAVRFFVEHHKNIETICLESAFRKWNEVGVKEKNLRPDTIRDRRNSMTTFVQKHGMKPLTNLNQATIKKFIYKPKISQVTKNGHIRVFKGFFKFCVEQGWLLKSPIESIKQGKVDPVEPKILSVDDARRLIRSAEKLYDGETLGYLALLLFAGLRPSEVHDGLLWEPKKKNALPLEWKHIDLSKKSPKALLMHTKGRIGRKLDLMPNCASLLRKVRRLPLIPKDGFKRKFNAVREDSGIEWKEDICRHSWVTYLFAKDQDLTIKTISRMAGNSKRILEKAYLNLSVTKKEGVKYFSIGL